jgi:hypothetical protein
MDTFTTMDQNGYTLVYAAPPLSPDPTTGAPPEGSLQAETPSGSEPSSERFLSKAESVASGGSSSHSTPTVHPQVAEMGQAAQMNGYQYNPYYHQTPGCYYVAEPQYDLNGYPSSIAYIEYWPESYSAPAPSEISIPNNYGYQSWQAIYPTQPTYPPPPGSYVQAYPYTTQPATPQYGTYYPSTFSATPDNRGRAPSNPGSTDPDPPLDIHDWEMLRSHAEKKALECEHDEWWRTKGWSRHERITLLDENARIKFVPKDLPADIPKPKWVDKVTTIFVVLLHHIPKNQRPLPKDDGPVPCFETMGDLVRIVSGKEACDTASLSAPEIKKKWQGRIAMCGYGKDGKGRGIARVIRGEQDVGMMYDTIVNVVENHRKSYHYKN